MFKIMKIKNVGKLRTGKQAAFDLLFPRRLQSHIPVVFVSLLM